MSKKVDIKSLEKRLSNVRDTAEDIQILSRWCLQHKNHHHSIVQAWSRAVRKTKVAHRLTLFYVCNDIVQNARRKKCMELVQHFGTAIKEAAPLVRDEKIRRKIVRIFHIWEERGIYDAKLIADFVEIVENVGTVNATENEVVLSNFQLVKLIEAIRNLIAYEKTSQCLLVDLKSQENVFSEEEILKLQNTVKERGTSNERLEDFDESMLSLECYNASLHKEIEERTIVVTLLEQAEIFYETQRGEAKLVANAYRNFSSQVKALKSKLTEIMSKLPEPLSPVVTPPQDAPSPTESDSDDMPIINAMDSSLNSFMDSSQIASMAQEAMKNFDANHLKVSPIQATRSPSPPVVDSAGNTDSHSKSPGYSFRDSYSSSYRDYEGRSRKRSSSRETDLDKEQKEFEAQISKISKSYLDATSISEFKELPKPMSAQELLDTFGKAYVKEKSTTNSANQPASFSHAHEQALAPTSSQHVSTPMPPHMSTHFPDGMSSKPPLPSNSILPIPLPPSEPSIPNEAQKLVPLLHDSYAHFQALPPNLQFPPPSPYPPMPPPSTQHSGDTWRMEVPNLWNPPPPPPPPPPINSESETYQATQDDWNDFNQYEDTPDLNDDETDNRNWGEVPGTEELQALSAEPRTDPPVSVKVPYFKPTANVQKFKERSLSISSLSGDRITHLVSIEPQEEQHNYKTVSKSTDFGDSTGYQCYDYRSLAQNLTKSNRDNILQVTHELKRFKEKAKLLQDSGSDMDISDSESTEINDNDHKGLRKKGSKVSNYDHATKRPRTIIPLTEEPVSHKNDLEERELPISLPLGEQHLQKISLSNQKDSTNLPVGVVNVMEKFNLDKNKPIFHSSSDVMAGVDTAAISEALKQIKEKTPLISSTQSISEAVSDFIKLDDMSKAVENEKSRERDWPVKREKSVEKSKSIDLTVNNKEERKYVECISPSDKHVESISEALHNYQSSEMKHSSINAKSFESSPNKCIESIAETLHNYRTSSTNFHKALSQSPVHLTDTDPSTSSIYSDNSVISDSKPGTHYEDMDEQIPITPLYNTSHQRNNSWKSDSSTLNHRNIRIENITEVLSEIRAATSWQSHSKPLLHPPDSNFPVNQEDIGDSSECAFEEDHQTAYSAIEPQIPITPLCTVPPRRSNNWNNGSPYRNQGNGRSGGHFRGNWGSPFAPKGYPPRGIYRGGRGQGFDPNRGRGPRRPMNRTAYW